MGPPRIDRRSSLLSNLKISLKPEIPLKNPVKTEAQTKPQLTGHSTADTFTPSTPSTRALTHEGPATEAASGKEAAERLKNKEQYWGPEGKNNRTQDFIDTVRAHQNDPAFLRELYANLSDAEVQELMRNASNLVVGDNQVRFESQADQQAALTALARSTQYLSPSAANALAKEAAAPGSLSPLVAVLKQPQASESMRRAFLDEAVKTAGDNFIDAQKFGEVLSSDPRLVKEYVDRLGQDAFRDILETGLEQPPVDLSPYAHGLTDMDGLGKVLGQLGGLQGSQYDAFKTQVFQDAVDILGSSPPGDSRRAGLTEGLSQLFMRSRDTLIEGMQTPNGELTVAGQKTLSSFFGRAMFSDPEFPSQGALRDNVTRLLSRMTDELNQYADTPSGELPNSVRRDARLMGSLVGSVEGGFQHALDDLKKRNDAVDGMVDLVFSAGGLIPDLQLPGYGIVKDLTLDQVKKWVQDSLHEDAPSADQAIPFHILFGEQLANPSLASDYGSTRSNAFINRQVGLS